MKTTRDIIKLMNMSLEREPGQVIDPGSDAGGRLPRGEAVLFPSSNNDISLYARCESCFMNRQDRGRLCLSVREVIVGECWSEVNH